MKASELDINGRPFSLELSPHVGSCPEEVPLVPKDSFILPASETLREEDRYYLSGGEYWAKTNEVGAKAGSRSFPYVRLIKDDQELYARMQAYAGAMAPATLVPDNQLESELAATEKRLNELKERIRQKDEIKAGDWVVVKEGKDGELVVGFIDKVLTLDKTYLSLENSCGFWFINRFRKATPAEIEGHLKKLEKEKEEKEKKESKNVEVTVDGVVYRTEYKRGHVQFGCAKISNRVIRAANDLCFPSNPVPERYRKVEAVQIGRGLFTREQLGRLAINLVD